MLNLTFVADSINQQFVFKQAGKLSDEVLLTISIKVFPIVDKLQKIMNNFFQNCPAQGLDTNGTQNSTDVELLPLFPMTFFSNRFGFEGNISLHRKSILYQ